MKRIIHLFIKDFTLGIKDVFILLEFVFALFIVLLLWFVIPEHFDRERAAYIYDETGLVESFMNQTEEVAEFSRRKGDFFVHSRREMIDGMLEDKNSVGLIIAPGTEKTYRIELLTQPYTSTAAAAIVETELEDFLAVLHPPHGIYPADVYESVEVRALQKGLKDELPFNQRILPPILLMMVGIIGLFATISLIGQERSEATLQAFRVTPGGMWDFIISKHLVILVTGFVTFSIIYLPMMGFAGYPEALLIIILTIILGSSIGVILGAFFDNPMEAILWVIVLMMALSLPAVSLFFPIFSPDWLKLIPSWYTLFGLDAAMFPDENRHIIFESAAILAAWSGILFALSGIIFNHRIRKEV